MPENLVSGVVINGVEGIHVCEIISPESPEITTYDINEVLKFKISAQSDFKNDDLKSYWEGYKDKIFTIYDNSESGTSRVWKCVEWPDTELYYSSFNDGIKRWIFMDMTLMGYTLNTQSTNPFDSNAQWEAFGHGDSDGPITLILEVIETQKTSN